MTALPKLKTREVPRSVHYGSAVGADFVWDPEALVPNRATLVSIDFLYKENDTLRLEIDILNVHRFVFHVDRINSTIRLESSKLGEIAEIHSEGLAIKGFAQDMSNPVNALRLLLELIEEAQKDTRNSKRHVESGDVRTSKKTKERVVGQFDTALEVLKRLREIVCTVIRDKLQGQLAEVESLIEEFDRKLPEIRKAA